MSAAFRRLFSGSGPRLKLSQSLGAFPLPGNDVSPLYAAFTVRNVGRADVGLVRVEVRPAGEGGPSVAVPQGDRPLPGPLPPGESAKFWVQAKVLSGTMKAAGHGGRPRLVLVVEDDLGGVHRQTFGFRVDDYLSLKDE